MMTEVMREGSTPLRRLDSWKSIARHLARSTRTVQRWHAEYGLPIHRLGGKKGPLFAYGEELDNWMRNRSPAEAEDAPEILRTLLPHAPPARKDSAQILGFSQPDCQAKARSAELVAVAFKMWEVLSYSNLRLIARHFREAIDLVPGNAAAFAGLSFALIAEGLWGLVRAPATFACAQAALQRALEIDSEQSEVLCAAAWLKVVSTRDWQGARRGFDEALRHQPRSTRAMVGRAMLHIA